MQNERRLSSPRAQPPYVSAHSHALVLVLTNISTSHRQPQGKPAKSTIPATFSKPEIPAKPQLYETVNFTASDFIESSWVLMSSAA